MMDVKVCSKCNRELLVSDFNKDKTKSDGLFSSCKDCRKEVSSNYYKEHGEEIRFRVSEYNRPFYEAKRVERERYELEHADEIEAQREARIEVAREAHRVRERARYNSDPEAGKRKCREYRRNNIQKSRARCQLSYAIKTGRLVRQPCDVCGELRGTMTIIQSL